MKNNDHLKLTSRVPFFNWIGLLFFWVGVFLLYTSLDRVTTIGSILGTLAIILMGLLILLLRRISLINRRQMTVGTYLGFIIPLIGESRILLIFIQRSIKNFDRVPFRHEETYISPEPGINPGGFMHSNYVGLANDKEEIKLATFDSLASSKKHAEKIETFLYSDD